MKPTAYQQAAGRPCIGSSVRRSIRFALLSISVCLSMPSSLGQDEAGVGIQVDARRGLGDLEPFWASQIIHPTERLMTDEGAEFLRLLAAAGAARQFVRIYNQPEEAIRVADDGSISYDWGQFDKMADMILATGNKLMVVFFGMPRELAAHPEAEKRRPNGATVCFSAPKDYRQWEAMCGDFTRHVIAKYGRDEVRQWTFRCWNEPNLPTFWHRADMPAYLKLYDHFAKGVKEVCTEIRIGGPGLASTSTYLDPKFYRMFLDHVANGRNHATGGIGSPIDFISVHTYGGSGAAGGPGRMFPDVAYLLEQQERYADMRDEHPQLKDLPIHVEEWGETASGNIGVAQKPTADVRNSEYGAAFLGTWVAHHIRMRQERDRKIKNFTFCASGYEAPRPHDFMGYRTLETKNGFHKPILNAYKLLNRLAPELVSCVTSPADGPISAFAARDGKRITVLATHYRHDKIHSEGDPMPVKLEITPHWPPGTAATLKQWRIDREHSNAYTVFRESGSPKDPTPEQIATVKNRMELELLEPGRPVDAGMPISLSLQLPTNSMTMIEITSD
jgi:xylan 1,4-beta-xylosidase